MSREPTQFWDESFDFLMCSSVLSQGNIFLFPPFRLTPPVTISRGTSYGFDLAWAWDTNWATPHQGLKCLCVAYGLSISCFIEWVDKTELAFGN